MRAPARLIVAVALAAVVAGCGEPSATDGRTKIRVGHFPNVTHAQALVAHGGTRAGKGFFEGRLGPDVAVEWHLYNAGPNAVEALLAGSIDLTYIGPSPALNAYVKSRGEDVRVVAGAARGGAALVVRGGSGIAAPADFRGRKIATPQLGNTQDVACRAWLAENGFTLTPPPGDVAVMPMQNPEIVTSFARGDVDAAWTVEPWVSRLVADAKGEVFLEEKDAVTTVLVASAKFLRESPDLALRFAKAHDELTEWVKSHEAEAKEQVRAELAVETRRPVPAEALAQAWPRIVFDASIDVGAFETFVKKAQAAGFLKDAGDLSRFVDPRR
jgi:NitT/TauT family transport system substrate-binding protein